MKRIQSKDLETIVYDGLPNAPITGVRWPPPNAHKPDWQNSEQNRIAQGIIQRFAKLDTASAQAAANESLSSSGRAHAIAAERAGAVQAVSDARSKAIERARRNAAERANLHALPTLDPGDEVGAIRDREIRDGIASLIDIQKQQLRTAMNAGKADHALHALLRDPLADVHASPEVEFAKNVWNDRIKAQKGEALATLEADDSLNEWLGAVASGHQSVLDRADTKSGGSTA